PVWQNPVNRWDVNNDAFVSAIDALLIINHLNSEGAGELSALGSGPPYLDCNGDNYVSAIDALMVINELNTASISRTLAANKSLATNSSPLLSHSAEPEPASDVVAAALADLDAESQVSAAEGERPLAIWHAALEAVRRRTRVPS
ncbi:MAG: hypothetical protein KDA92_21545, partial [Planctomycetales bacterium]|nr:hypothetical protein [Planctomycetales bacterium]